MKVRELIAMLQAVDPELDVRIEYETNDRPNHVPVDRVVHKAVQWAAVVVPRLPASNRTMFVSHAVAKKQ